MAIIANCSMEILKWVILWTNNLKTLTRTAGYILSTESKTSMDDFKYIIALQFNMLQTKLNYNQLILINELFRQSRSESEAKTERLCIRVYGRHNFCHCMQSIGYCTNKTQRDGLLWHIHFRVHQTTIIKNIRDLRMPCLLFISKREFEDFTLVLKF